jgi:transaldolase
LTGTIDGTRLCQLHAAGVSIWLDTLSRELLTTGTFGSLVESACVTGATSNPTIFAAAIQGADGYEEQLRSRLAAGERDAEALFLDLALADVSQAADLLRPAFETSGGRDGFVSFECTPTIAYDTDATIDQARMLWDRLNRPNVMIKVPGTAPGVTAVEQLTADGVNVNITLLFARARYEQVIHAYQSGLERRIAAHEPIENIASVASFFVSRIDTKVDPRLPEGSPLRGRIAIANAKLAYQSYRGLHHGPRWERLAGHGAGSQHPLWASTGTKNPAYSDVQYVEELIGPDVVNTMPDQTLRAFADHGRVGPSIERGVDEAEVVLYELASTGTDLDAITTELEHEGITSFCDSYRGLLECIIVQAEHLGFSLARPALLADPGENDRQP